MQSVLVTVNNALCVRVGYVQQETPMLSYYNLPACRLMPNHDGTRTPRAGDLLTASTSEWDRWSARDPKTQEHTGHVYAEYPPYCVRVDEAILCPRVRSGIATRWHEGVWQKRLKSGWTNA